MSKTFVPYEHQEPLKLDQFIQNNPPEGDEDVPMDVIFVGAGPAGLAGATELAKLVKADPELNEVEIGVLEKAENLGGHNLSGAVVNPRSLRELFPELKDEDFPFRGKVKGDRVYLLSETGKMRLPTPPTMHNSGNYVTSICELVRWMGGKAEELGVNMLTSFPADSLLMDGDKVTGVLTTPAGLDRSGNPGAQHMPSTVVRAGLTVLTEGTRGPLAQAYIDKQKLVSKQPQIFALGVKEVWRVKKPLEHVTHTLGWPLPKNVFGGSWMYPMGDDLVSLGLVAGLDYRQGNLDVHKLLQGMKEHPLFKEVLEGGELEEWGAKTIPEGGLHSLPEKLYGNGLLMAGDCVGMVNVPALKGIHYAIQAGIYAGRAAYEALKAQDFSEAKLKKYDDDVRSSFIFSDLKKVRNMRPAFKGGFYSGGVKASLMTLTGGAFPGDGAPHEEDAKEWKDFDDKLEYKNTGISKVDAVYKSGNKTRDDIPQHLTVGKDISPELADFYTALCPAGVYERQGDELIVNAPNCVDCKATDVLGPRWQPREGGAGPDYKMM